QTYTTIYSYDILNRLRIVTDNSNNPTNMNYDWLGRKMEMIDPDLGHWYYGYDNAGNLTRQTDAKQQTTCMYYDALNRLKGKNYRSDTACPADPMSGYAVGYQYDLGANGIGRRTSMTYQSATTQWNYDPQGRLLSQTDTLDGTPYTTGWTYDAMNRATLMTYPDGEQVTTGYNTQGLPSTLTSPLASYVTASGYSAASQLTSLAFGNGITTTYTYNPQNLRLTQLQTTALQNLNYVYDSVGNITQITDTVRSEVTTFGYDDFDRLTSASIAGVYSQGWTYDPLGNITLRTDNGAPTAYGYTDAAHKHAVTQVGTTTYAYDPNGNMTNRNGQTLSYDTENRLTQVISGTVTTQYVYNADGARVKKIVGGVTTYYVGNYYEVTSGAVTKYYYFGAQRVAMRTSAGVTYLHSDHLGSTSVAVDASGALQSRQTYYAFGGMRTSDVAPITSLTDYSYTGQKLDSDGLMYYNARYYDAAIGRFLQPDSIIPNQFNPQSLNHYAYVRNNPVRYTDPTGQTCRFGREDCEAMYEEEHPTEPATTGGDQTPSGGGEGAKTTTIGPDPNLHGYRVQNTFTWKQASFECYAGFCATATSIDYGDMVTDITIGTQRGRTGGQIVRMQFDPTQKTLKGMELSVDFVLQNSQNRFSQSQRYVLAGGDVFDFYQNSRDMPVGPSIDVSPSVDVRGGLPIRIDFYAAKIPPYEFSFGYTKGIDSFAWTVPKLLP
ncbi:MAG: RHS repeat-associated core domain-containing protein, partial [Chloroflexota bacterium]|nr:RHS repeat-associated core domain-containing protein [Chloroflexota bacterium]